MKVAELEGALLDYWVARAEDKPYAHTHDNECLVGVSGVLDMQRYAPSTDWADGGPIIERERIEPYHRDEDGSDNVWHAVCPMPRGYESLEDGPTLLIAAMRAYVASKFGDEVSGSIDSPLSGRVMGVTNAKAKPFNTASIASNLFCKACGWPVIHACCNDEMGVEPWGTDYWAYCSNKGCQNHKGEDWGQFGVEFAFQDDAARLAG